MKGIRAALVWIAVGFVGAVLSGLGDRVASVLWPDASAPDLSYSQQWRTLSRIYWAVTEKEADAGRARVVGVLPFYEHTITLENSGSRLARDVAIEVSGVTELHQVSVTPSTVKYEVKRQAAKRKPLDPANLLRNRAIVRIPSVAPGLTLEVKIARELVAETAGWSEVVGIVSDNAPPGANTSPLTEKERKRIKDGLNRDAAIQIEARRPLDGSAWEEAFLNVVVEIIPGHQEYTAFPERR